MAKHTPKHGEEKNSAIQLSFNQQNIIPLVFTILLTGVSIIAFPYLFFGLESNLMLIPYVCIFLITCILLIVKTNFSEKVRRAFSRIFLFIAPLLTVVGIDSINDTYLFTNKATFVKWLCNYLCALMIFLFVYIFARSTFWTTLIAGGIINIFGIANYYTIQFRGSPILPWDIKSLGTATDVMSNYDFKVTPAIYLSVYAFIALLILLFKMKPTSKNDKKEYPNKRKLAERGIAAFLFAVVFALIVPINLMSTLGVEVWPWNQKASTRITGVLAGFFGNIQFIMVEKPDGYSENIVQDIYSETISHEAPKPLGKPKENPTIIAVMNESFTDLASVADNIEITPDNIPFTRSLIESGECIAGTAYSSVYGGNTCDTEYEFLTGNSMAFLPIGSKPYQQYIKDTQIALPWLLSDYGYDTIAIHPGTNTAWNRQNAYPHLGFDRFTYGKIFNTPRSRVREMTSDKSCYDEVIYEFEHKGDNPLFIFNVTIQNHGGFDQEDYPSTISLNGNNSYPLAEQYMTLIEESDKQFEYLVDYFEDTDEPVVILFFGDHWPQLSDEFITDLLGLDNIHDREISEYMREFEVPFVIWANYPLEAENIEQISMNYLSGLLLRSAGLETTPYQNFLEELRADLPVITEVGIIDKNGTTYEHSAKTAFDDKLNDYAILQYNNAFDKDDIVSDMFTNSSVK